MREYQRCERQARDRVAQFYDRWYAETKGRWFDRREREIFARSVVPGSMVLDVGSGTGRITASVARSAAAAVALDFSLDSLSCIREKGIPRVAAVGGDAVLGLPFRPGAFDAIVSCQMLQHLRHEDLCRAMRECRRVLKTGGCFYFAVYNFDYWRFRRMPERVDEGGLFYRRFSPRCVRNLAGASGFAVRRLGYYKALPARCPGAGAFHGGLLARADRLLCGIPGLQRLASAYLFVELEASTASGQAGPLADARGLETHR